MSDQRCPFGCGQKVSPGLDERTWFECGSIIDPNRDRPYQGDYCRGYLAGRASKGVMMYRDIDLLPVRLHGGEGYEKAVVRQVREVAVPG